MEIRHTIEILTKDIQDIEKLVGNLQNSQHRSTLELDLVLSKLRNVYEIISMIREDLHLSSREPAAAPPADPAPEAPRPPEAAEKSDSEAGPEPVPATGPEPADAGSEGVSPAPATQQAEPEKSRREAGIIAEKFSKQSSINENMAGQRAVGMDSKLMGKPIDSIGRNIGINDRFLIIRELFNGDAESFGSLVQHLDSAGSYGEAVGIIEEKFSGEMDHEGVGILVGLTKRRFSRE